MFRKMVVTRVFGLKGKGGDGREKGWGRRLGGDRDEGLFRNSTI